MIRKANMHPGAFSLLEQGKTVPLAPAELEGAYPIEVLVVRTDQLEEWDFLQDLADVEEVDAALRELVEDSTNDNGVRVVPAVLKALSEHGQ